MTSITFKMDSARFRNNIQSLSTLFHTNLKDTVKIEARKFVKACIDLTPPQGGKHSGTLEKGDEGWEDTPRRQGEKAVERDIKRAVYPSDKIDLFTNPTSKKMLRLIANRDLKGITEFIQHIPAFRNKEVVNFSPALHQAARKARGRVPSQSRSITLDNPAVKSYIAQMQTHVGHAKAGWSVAYRACGGHVPGWVSRALPKGSVEMLLDDPKNPRVSITNSAGAMSYLNSVERIVDHALKGRLKAMERNIENTLERAKKASHVT
jgi:hypothetical protein